MINLHMTHYQMDDELYVHLNGHIIANITFFEALDLASDLGLSEVPMRVVPGPHDSAPALRVIVDTESGTFK